MIVVFIYVVLSIVFYVKLFQAFQSYSSHPEMKKVKPGEKLLGVRFSDSPRSLGDEQSSISWFTEFLSDHPADDRDNGGA